MAHESLSTATYAAVIQDLRAKRDELDRMIAALEGMAGIKPSRRERAIAPSAPPTLRTPSPTPQQDRPTANAGTNNGIGEACVRILREQDPEAPLSTRQVTDLLLRDGFAINTANPVNNVWNALANRSKTKRDVRKDEKGWRYVGSEKATFPRLEAASINGQAAHR